MAFMNIRQLLEHWERSGRLLKVRKEVDPKFELGAVIKAVKGRQPMVFQKVKVTPSRWQPVLAAPKSCSPGVWACSRKTCCHG